MIELIAKKKTFDAEIAVMRLLDCDLSIRCALEFMGQKVDTKSNVAEDKFNDYCNMVRANGGINIKNLESDGETQIVSFGDYIIKGERGEFHSCKPDVFRETHDFVERNHLFSHGD